MKHRFTQPGQRSGHGGPPDSESGVLLRRGPPGRGRAPRRSPLGHLYADLNARYREHLACRALRGGHVGQKTRRERRVVIERALRDLHRGGVELRRLKNFRAKHVHRILNDWRARALAPSTLSTYISHLRTFCGWLKKPQLIELLDDVVAAEPELVRRRTVTDVDKSERAIDLNIQELLHRAKALDERFAAQLGLIVAFGLRSREAWLCRPHLVLERARKEGVVRVEWGTKGGRYRVLQCALTAEHLAVLEWACTFAKARSESMIPPRWTVQQWRRHYYGCCEKLGLTRRALGVTPHAFRHGVLLDLYEWLTGHPAPARGGTLAQTDPLADRAARELVSAHAGHAEIYITSAYLGGLRPRGETTAQDGEIALSPSHSAYVTRSETVAGSSSRRGD
jgi:integrase